MNLTEKELIKMREAIYMITDAKSKIEDINSAMTRDGRWRGQADIQAVVSNLNELMQLEHF